MPAKSEKQRKFMAIVREYKRGKRKNVGKKVRDAAKGMSDKEITDFMKKSMAMPMSDIRSYLSGIGDKRIAGIATALKKRFGLPEMPTANQVESSIDKYYRLGGGDPTTSSGKAIFADRAKLPEAMNQLYGSPERATGDIFDIVGHRKHLEDLLESVERQRVTKQAQAQNIVEGVPNTDLYGAAAGAGLAGLGGGAMLQGNRIIKGVDKWEQAMRPHKENLRRAVEETVPKDLSSMIWNRETEVSERGRAAADAIREYYRKNPEQARAALMDYIRGAKSLSEQRVGGFQVGTLLKNRPDLLPTAGKVALEDFMDKVPGGGKVMNALPFLRPADWQRGQVKGYRGHYADYASGDMDRILTHELQSIIDSVDDRYVTVKDALKLPGTLEERMARVNRALANVPPKARKEISERINKELSSNVLHKLGDLGSFFGHAEHYTRQGKLAAKGFKGLGRLAAVTGLGGASVLAAKNIIERLRGEDKTAQAKEDLKETAQLAGAGSAMALSPYLLLKGLKNLRSDNLVGVTYGSEKPIGAGHATPAGVMLDLLKERKEFSGPKAKYQLLDLERDATGRIRKLPEKMLGGELLSTFETGFGLSNRYGRRDTKLRPIDEMKVRPGGRTAYIADWASGRSSYGMPGTDILEHPSSNPLGVPGKIFDEATGEWKTDTSLLSRARRFLNRHLGQKSKIYGYGPFDTDVPALMGKEPRFNYKNVGEVAPLIKGDVVEKATAPFNREEAVEAILREAKEKGYEGAEQLRDAIKKGKRIVTISGSGRGDVTATRAKSLLDALKKNKMDDVTVLNLMAGAYNDKNLRAMAGDSPNLINLGGLYKDNNFVNAQRLADLHWGSTGTSSLVESLLNQNNAAFIGDEPYAYKMLRETELGNIKSRMVPPPKLFNAAKMKSPRGRAFLEKYFAEHDFGPSTKNIPWTSMTPEQADKALAQIFADTEQAYEDVARKIKYVDLDSWNEGNRRWAFQQEGVHPAVWGDDIVEILKRTENFTPEQLEQIRAGRVEKVLKGIKGSQKTMVDDYIKHLNKLRVKKRLAGAGKIGAGLGGAGLIGKYIYDKLKGKREQQ